LLQGGGHFEKVRQNIEKSANLILSTFDTSKKGSTVAVLTRFDIYIYDRDSDQY